MNAFLLTTLLTEESLIRNMIIDNDPVVYKLQAALIIIQTLCHVDTKYGMT